MIGFIKGTLEDVQEDRVILETNGIGYQIRVPALVTDRLPAHGSEVKLYTSLQVREDDVSLFGFLSRDELDVFKLLLGVSGVGPKAALGILSALSCNDLRIAVHAQDAKAIAKAPGIGAKTAQRIIIDLKDRLSLEDALQLEETNYELPQADEMQSVQKDAIEALTALGYSASTALAAVRKVEDLSGMTVEECLKKALKYL